MLKEPRYSGKEGGGQLYVVDVMLEPCKQVHTFSINVATMTFGATFDRAKVLLKLICLNMVFKLPNDLNTGKRLGFD